MNTIPVDVQMIIYKYIQKDLLRQGFDDIFPVTSESSPFKMNEIIFNKNGGNLIEHCNFKSEMCSMCFSRNIDTGKSLEDWMTCDELLYNMETFSVINGIAYLTDYDDNILKKTVIRRINMNSEYEPNLIHKSCMYRQLFDLYKYYDLDDLQDELFQN